MEKINVVSIQMVKEKEMEVYAKKISQPNDVVPVVVPILENYLGDKDREYLVVLTLNTKNVITSISTVSMGSLNSSIAHPREIFKTAVLGNAASIILSHNHPSGDPTPSREDINITQRVKEGGKILGIELLDHIIIGDTYVSLKEKGII